MRHRVSRCVLLALLAAFSAVPAAANSIVANFYFQRDVCDFGCEAPFFEYFGLVNLIDQQDPIVGGLTFSAFYKFQHGPDPVVDITTYGFFDLGPGLGITENLAAGLIFDRNSLFLIINDAGRYTGTLSLENFVYEDPPPQNLTRTFSADVVYRESGPVAVTEAPSWLVVVFGFGALAVGRALLV